MKFLPWMCARVARAPLPPPPPPAASGGPISPIYRFSGVYDNGGGVGTGTFSAVHCSNFSAVSEDIVVAVRQWDGSLLAVGTFTLSPFRTWTAVTHQGAYLSPDTTYSTGSVFQGM